MLTHICQYSFIYVQNRLHQICITKLVIDYTVSTINSDMYQVHKKRKYAAVSVVISYLEQRGFVQAFDFFCTFMFSPVGQNFYLLQEQLTVQRELHPESKRVLLSGTGCCYCRILSSSSLYVRQIISQINMKKFCHLLKRC